MRELPPILRLPLLILGMVALVAGVLSGLARLGIEVPAVAGAQAVSHGALMISGFFGTVISLERAVALRLGWPYLGPLGAGLGGVALLAGLPAPWPHMAMTAGALILALASGRVWRQQPARFTLTLALGATCWLAGNLAWLFTGDLLAAVPLWLAFLVLTIAGERLELTRFLPPRPQADRSFLLLLGLLLTAAILAVPGLAAGERLLGIGLFGLALWLLRYDIARKTVRQQGLTRFVAVCLLSGYVWLAVGGALIAAGALAVGAPGRDGALHAVFLGFVFSMVIGHAPIIFPAVMRVRIPYHPAFYLPLLALHLSVAARLIGNFGELWAWRQAGGLANALALLVFILTLVSRVLYGLRTRATP